MRAINIKLKSDPDPDPLPHPIVYIEKGFNSKKPNSYWQH